MNYHKLFVAVSLGLALTGVVAQPALAKKAPSVPAWEEAQLNADKDASVKSEVNMPTNSSVKSKANVPTSSSVNDKDVIWQTSVDDENNKGDSSLLKKIRERMKDKDKKAQVAKKRKAEPDFKSLPESVAKYKPQYLLPDEYQSLTIFGKPLATEEQAVALLNILNPKPKLTCSVKDIVHYYWKEAGKEGIRPDVAFAQAILETGTFRYGGDVLPTQNNFCGLGTVGGGVKGATFKDAEMGVRAHIQHLTGLYG
jgi:flagellum-specific peptidoglycan hydrolase FlgJ